MIICQTSRYRFEINYDEKTFSLLAISLPDGHCSNINTLNETLSAFDMVVRQESVELVLYR